MNAAKAANIHCIQAGTAAADATTDLRNTMDNTELAHWRYRVKALSASLPVTDRARWRWTPGKFPWPTEDEAQALHDQYSYELWLLEEAKYKIELGEVEQRNGSQAH